MSPLLRRTAANLELLAAASDPDAPDIRRRGTEEVSLLFRTKTNMPVTSKLVRGSITDITERRRAEEALREADRRKDEFLATLGHELRNPLTPIQNSLEILRLAGTHLDVRSRTGPLRERADEETSSTGVGVNSRPPSGSCRAPR